jgi:hypothetical protein
LRAVEGGPTRKFRDVRFDAAVRGTADIGAIRSTPM